MSARGDILEAWYQRTVNTYPAEARLQLLGGGDQFRNPVAFTIRTSLATMLDEIEGGMNVERLEQALDGIIHLRAVQDFSAAEAVRFVFFLRDIACEGTVVIPDIDRRIDQLALVAFDSYMQCREQVAVIRAREAAAPTAHMRCRA